MPQVNSAPVEHTLLYCRTAQRRPRPDEIGNRGVGMQGMQRTLLATMSSGVRAPGSSQPGSSAGAAQHWLVPRATG